MQIRTDVKKCGQIETHISFARFIHLCPIRSASLPSDISLTSRAFHVPSARFNPRRLGDKTNLGLLRSTHTFSHSFKCEMARNVGQGGLES